MYYKRTDVENLIKEHDTRDPFQLCKDLDIRVGYNNDFIYLRGFYWCVEGFPYIVLNGNIEGPERTMVLAHELAHDQLHRDLARIAPMQDFLLFGDTREECEANSFAADLLIPDDVILELIEAGENFSNMYRTIGYHPQLVLFKMWNLKRDGHSFNIPDVPDSSFLGQNG